CDEGEKRHIIFWYDPEAEFEDDIGDLKIDNAKIWRLNDNNNFKTKYHLEVEDTKSNYLIYCSNPKPPKRENWLLDTLKYSQEFTADKTTLIMRDFNVEEEHLRPAFNKYKKFFNNKKRYNRLKKYNIQEFDQIKLDKAIFSALCRLKTPDVENGVKKLLMTSLDENSNRYWEQIAKFGDPESVWNLIAQKYGYLHEEKTLKDLMLMLLITNLRHNLNRDLPDSWQNYVFNRETDCVVFINHWMNHAKDAKQYDKAANDLENEIKLTEYLVKWEIKDFIQCESFKIIDKIIINRIIESLLSDTEEFDWFKEVISIRKTKHWYKYFKEIYDAIYWAIELLQLTRKYDEVIKQESTYDFFNRYQEEYYLLDKAYRRLYTAYDQVENKSILTDLREKIENLYSNWYLQQLAVKFSNSIEDEEGWDISGLQQQRDFFDNYIERYVKDEERVFVIISDGLRYEAAVELEERLKNEFKAATEITSMQGNLPSETGLGMASLLPNKELSITENQEIFVDGKKTKSTDDRREVLSSYVVDSVVLKANDVKQMTRDQMRDVIYGKNLIYIFHDRIDATGDNHKTEDEVFQAVEKTFSEIEYMVKALVNNVSASTIFITSDHGFIYRRRKLEASDKTRKEHSDNEKESKRYIITKSPQDFEGGISKDLDYIFADTDFKVVVPRGVNTFQTSGPGYNYVHGGASLQEIVIPVIRFKNDRSDSDKNEIKKVDVKLTNISRKITNSIFTLEFFQTEKVAEKVVPRRLKIYFVDKEGNKITNENVVIADSSSEKPEDRTYKEKFTLKNQEYRRDENYYLIMEDEEESVEKEYEKTAFKISLAINSDFEF
ncbi:MAG: BREX-1 system phosphatase PglZ type A, partial [Halanaerobiales bacterium]